jgi:crotonobetainyl-CoA:carnitine CoA-transferase CaiB-like acyl-CoA transferase
MTVEKRSGTPVASESVLAGVRVLEISTHVAGAYCGKVLGQLGAHVTRWGPATDVLGLERTRRVAQAFLHQGKLDHGLDLAPVDAALAQADIIILEHLDAGHPLAQTIEDILARRAAVRDEAVVVQLAPAMADGQALPGCALTSAAWSAMTCAIGEPAREPLTLPYDLASYEAGISAAAAALAGLLGGFGIARGPVEIAERDVLANFVGILTQNYLPFGRPWRRDGRIPFMSGGVYPCGLFVCSDGYIAVYCRGDGEWKGILKAMGDPDWSREERFRDPRIVARHHAAEADSHFFPWLARQTRQQLIDLGMKFGFPVGSVRGIEEVLHDEQFEYRKSLQELAVAGERPVQVPGVPWRLYEAPVSAAAAGQTAARLAAAAARDAQARSPASLLRGLRVLDLSWVWSGPMVTSMLADLGAEVLKIEHPSKLDSVRLRGRPQKDGVELQGPSTELNPWFNQLNHGKRSVVLDMKSAQDQATLRKLAESCDVVVENMRPGALVKSGLGYAELSAANPSIVMLSMSMAGQSGPLSQMKGYAGIMSAMAGLESLVGYELADGTKSLSGMTKTALGDPNAAMHAITMLMAALHRRRKTGRGLWIDLAQTDAILAILGAPVIESQLYGRPGVMGNRHPLYAPHGQYPCTGSDQWVAIAVHDDARWQSFCGVAALPSALAELDAPARVERWRDIDQAVAAWTAQHSREQVMAALAPLRIAVAPVTSYEELMASPWKRERQLTQVVNHPWLGEQEIFVPPWRFGGQLPGVNAPAPLLGADTEAVLNPLFAHAAVPN